MGTATATKRYDALPILRTGKPTDAKKHKYSTPDFKIYASLGPQSGLF
jgi:hypothetical protein